MTSISSANNSPELRASSLGETVHCRVAMQVNRNPNAVAISSGAYQLTYRELDERSARIAHRLLEAGLTREDRVALALDRSPELVISALAVLRSGAVCVPLDRRSPSSRLGRILEEARPAMLLVDGSFDETSLPSLPGVVVVDVGENVDGPAAPAIDGHPDQAAYLVYTSGSTGRPKAATITHRNVVSMATQGFWANGSQRRMLFHSNHSWDAAILEWWVPLLGGDQLVVAPAGQLDIRALGEVVEKEQITRLVLPAGLLSLVAQEDPAVLRPVHELITGGDVVPATAVRSLFAACPDITVRAVYGPVETTAFVTHHLMTSRETVGASIPIGSSVATSRVYILDDALSAAASGVVGEVYIAGEQVSRGYWDQPGLTAHRYVADPHGVPGSRMYRTGDLARRTADGVLEFVGRADNQVKVRGFRIELGEVEATLAEHPGVAQAAVVVREDLPGEKSLVAYIVPAQGPDTGDRESAQVDGWRELYNDVVYTPEASSDLVTDDFSFWISSYDGAPIPQDEMQEWRTSTLRRIRELGPQRVLEIGVGSGLILSGLSAECDAYWGTDLSETAITRLTRQVKQNGLDDRVVLRAQPADDPTGIPTGFFDTVIMNSVSQYFPSAAYLNRVIASALKYLVPGGRLFIGDVRNLLLLEAFRTGIRIAEGHSNNDPSASLREIELSVRQEEELLVDPRFFEVIRRENPDIGYCSVLVKQGAHHNELTRHRYDVVLHKQPAKPVPPDSEHIIPWTPGSDVLEQARQYLQEGCPGLLRLVAVPNARVAGEAAAYQALLSGEPAWSVPACPSASEGLEPDVFFELARESHREVAVTWAEGDTHGHLDVFFAPPSTTALSIDTCRYTENLQSSSSYTNVPSGLHAALTAPLLQFVAGVLPDYMVPAAVVELDALPLTTNGKIDRRALPAPRFAASASGREPRTPQEEILCGLFAEVLRLDKVGIDDDFFDLGGHSLLATRLTSRIRSALGVEVAIRTLFEASTVAALSGHVATGEVARPPLEAVERPDVLPLSFAQRRLWFLDRLEGPGATYNIPMTQRLTGAVNQSALRAALGDVVRRHESLRTVFPSVDGEAVQRIIPADQALPVLDVVTTESPEQVGQAVAAATRYGFDLTSELPLRATLLTTGPDEHLLILVLHHIAADGWSLAPFWRDLAEAYEARCSGTSPSWSPLPVQYADYALWQDELLGTTTDENSVLTRQLNYWRATLKGMPDEISLPFDRPRPAVASHRGDIVRVDIDPTLHNRLTLLARECHATLFMVIQTTLAVLASKLGAGTDLPIGTVTAGRLDESLDDLVGFFVNTLVLRTDTSGNPTFRDLLTRVRTADLKAYEHQDLPFERLVEELNPTRSMARHPLFQVMVAFQNNAQAVSELPGLRVEPEFSHAGIAKFDLSLNLSETFAADGTPAGMSAIWEFATDLLNRSSVQAMADRFTALLETFSVSPDTLINDADVLTLDERHQMLEVWNDTAHALPEMGLPRLFEAQVARTPDAPAVTQGQTTLTYAQVNDRANRLAHHLIRQGVTHETAVAVLHERSPDMVIAILAVLKAGGLYVPLDSRAPRGRLSQMMLAGKVSLLLTDQAPHDLDFAAGLPVVRYAQVPFTQERADNPDRPIHPDQLAYLMFTSGSTGTPKGVAATHRNLVELVLDPCWGNDRHARVLGYSPLAFDSSTYELWVPLTTGKHIVLAPPGKIDAAELQCQIIRHGVTAAYFTTALFDVMSQEALAGLSHLREIWTGGDVLSTVALRRVLSASPDTRVVHVYGPTETTVFCSYQAFDAPWRAGDALNVGDPMANTTMYVLDSSLQPVPTGVTGELYVGGTGLARGYLQQSGLTAERFVADPYGPVGSRMYRTGDLARWTATGTVEFLGRADSQVKIRGFRIEPGEIEAVLSGHDSVAQAAVIVREDRPGDKQLVAYTVPTSHSTTSTDLRRHIAGVLPDYMVPAAVVELDALPLTTNGKIDRRALPAPRFAASASGREPRTPQEEILCGLFAEVLRLDKVGIDDDFFDLGGHSLLATRLTSRIRSALGVEVAIRTLFEASTVAALSGHVATGEVARPPLEAVERPDVLPLSFAQRRLWFLDRLEGPGATYNIPMTQRLTGAVNQSALRAALGDVVRRHESLRTVFPSVDGEAVQRIIPADQALPVLDVVTTESPEQVGQAVAAATRYGFDLTSELPLRATLLTTGPDEHLLILVLHHIAADGWSLAPFWRDLAEAYEARCSGTSPSWSPLPVQYADYALWQDELLGTTTDENSVLTRQLNYWRATLKGMPDEISLPFDRPRPAVASHRGDIVRVDIDPTLHNRLTLLARECHATLFMVIQAGAATLLSRLGAGGDIPLGSIVAGRLDESLDDLVGFFVNTLVLRTDTSGNPTFRDLLTRVRTADLKAYEHQDLPFERLVEELNPTRSMARHPLFQVMVGFQNNARTSSRLVDALVAPEMQHAGIAKFDLSLNLTELHGPQDEPAGISATWEFATDLFDRSTVQGIAERFVRLLASLASDPDVRIGHAEILSAVERNQTLPPQGVPPLAPDTTLPQLFEAQAARTPDAVALTGGDTLLTYRDLDSRANQIAHHLISQGVEPGSRVLILQERSPEVVISALAIMKCGAVYVPLDHRSPMERLRAVASEVAPVAVLTDGSFAQLAAEIVDHQPVINLDKRPSPAPAFAPGVPVYPDQVAYIMYTSGSTGMPKGVANTHRNVVSMATQGFWTDKSRERVLFHSPHAWDAATVEWWVPLLHGGQIIVAPAKQMSIGDLSGLIADERITGLVLAAGLFRLVAEESPMSLASVRELITGGDVVPASAVRQALTACPDLTVMAVYGPVETTSFVLSERLADAEAIPKSVPLGTALETSRVYVLDDLLEPVPAGVPGELYVAGSQLAQCYWQQPSLTAERFVPDPFGPAGTRMYRTGDLVRWTATSTLEFLGRSDNQVKLRGFRVELGEIEAVLTGHPDVAQAAVVVHENEPGDQRMIAYVVKTASATSDEVDLRRHVAESLPDYMVPAVVVPLEELPLTSNGKLDRRALPEPQFISAASSRGPRTEQEETLCALFVEILGINGVGIDDNFFDLGGHSLLATRLISRIRTVLGTEVAIATLFQTPTVAGLAEHLATRPMSRPRLRLTSRKRDDNP